MHRLTFKTRFRLNFQAKKGRKKMTLKEAEKEGASLSHPKHLYPRKMILKLGAKHFLLDTSEIVYCYSNHKIVYVVDVNNHKYVYDKNLLRLEEVLDPNLFFKVNRTQIVNFNFIRSFVTHDKNKIKLELKTAAKEEVVYISQTRVNAFRAWVYKQL